MGVNPLIGRENPPNILAILFSHLVKTLGEGGRWVGDGGGGREKKTYALSII
jgi:hypothetical protein